MSNVCVGSQGDHPFHQHQGSQRHQLLPKRTGKIHINHNIPGDCLISKSISVIWSADWPLDQVSLEFQLPHPSQLGPKVRGVSGWEHLSHHSCRCALDLFQNEFIHTGLPGNPGGPGGPGFPFPPCWPGLPVNPICPFNPSEPLEKTYGMAFIIKQNSGSKPM